MTQSKTPITPTSETARKNSRGYPIGWHSNGKEIVWASGEAYTETGNAPGRVSTAHSHPRHGVFWTWDWIDDLKAVDLSESASFMEDVRGYYGALLIQEEARIREVKHHAETWEHRARIET